MKVTLTRAVKFNRKHYNAGDTVEFPDDVGAHLVATGHVDPAEAAKAAAAAKAAEAAKAAAAAKAAEAEAGKGKGK